ncbi:hypothetical protein [Streptomyces sp. NPDC051636]|uniref:hypothetical protein n=1 Tax=Streptomyces sp. NPDC051636 TaxID=3365663 RepID=UPI0037B51406
MSNPTRTVSGAHPYRPQCVIASAREIYTNAFETDLHPAIPELAVQCAERITTAIDAGVCPRCSDPLHPNPAPDGWQPAGSRATTCRCIPVCETCAGWVEPSIGVLAVTGWPTDADDGEDLTRKEIEVDQVQQAKANCTVGVLETGPGGTVLVTTEGATPFEVQFRPHPGGWLEFGYDDSADEVERRT